MTQYIWGSEFIQKLIDVGILDNTKGIRRVVIDACFDDVVSIEVEFVGDSLLLEAIDTLEGVKPVEK